MRDRLKYLYHQSWDQDLINAVGVLKYHPPTFQDFMTNYLLEQNKLWVEYGVEWQLKSNVTQRTKELQQELCRVRQEREDLEEQIREKKDAGGFVIREGNQMMKHLKQKERQRQKKKERIQKKSSNFKLSNIYF